MRHASEIAQDDKEVIVALEEPESHLHPRAIRELKGVLEDLLTSIAFALPLPLLIFIPDSTITDATTEGAKVRLNPR
jgi:hypothetical protein